MLKIHDQLASTETGRGHRIGSTRPERAAHRSTQPTLRGHHVRAEVGTCVAGLVLGIMIQTGPRRRARTSIPSQRRADIVGRSASSISCADLRAFFAAEEIPIQTVEISWAAALASAGDLQLASWENEGGRVRGATFDVEAPYGPVDSEVCIIGW